ncbi:MAG TPA: type II CAAX endopeptidase family protein [Pyrinomonadaceae bacterium]|nr:type II CAAX endopeptidase family protein [Pyrinomonadaceae bacterium]
MNDLFLNSVGRLRSGWRFAIFTALFFFFSIVLQVALFFTIQIITGDEKVSFLYTPQGLATTSLISTVLATILGWLCGKIFEDLPLKALGWVFNRTWLKDFLLGLILGGLSIAFAVLLAMPTDGISLVRNQTTEMNLIVWTLISSFGVFFIAAAAEEVMFRGYVMQTLFRAKLAWLGILLTSLPFALAHLGNPDANIISTINTGLAGIWFGIAYLKTRSLWFPFGLHLAWNWFQGAVFGINVSGISQIAPNPLLRAIDQGPTWLTGGHYGVEAGFVCTIALLVSMLLIWFLPTLKPTADMLALTDQENPKSTNLA